MGENTYGFLPPTILLLWTPPPLPLSFPSTVGAAVRPTFTGPRGVRPSTPRPTDRSRSGHAAQVRRGLHWRDAFVRAAAHIHGAPFRTAARDAPELRLRALRLAWVGAIDYEMRKIALSRSLLGARPV